MEAVKTINAVTERPYVGPRPFEPGDKNLFFGRDVEGDEILSLLLAHPVLLIYAQSGAGKSSLLNAKLIPMLEDSGFARFGPARVQEPSRENLNASDISNIYCFHALVSGNAKDGRVDKQSLARLTLDEYLGQHPVDKPRALIFDQFEELFTFYPERWKDRRNFFVQIAKALENNPRLRCVFVMREEFIAKFDEHAFLLPEKCRTRYDLRRLGREAALQAIKGPLAGTNRRFAAEVPERLTDELLDIRVKTEGGTVESVSDQFVEPVQLQVVCQSLWENLPPEVTQIEQRHVDAFGDVTNALSLFYENCIARATDKTGVKEVILRRWFDRTLITPAGTRGMVYRDKDNTGGIPNETVELLDNEMHLIRPEVRSGERWYELNHDRFIEPIKEANRKWFLRHFGAKELFRRLSRKAEQWSTEGRNPARVLSETELTEAESWLADAEGKAMADEELRVFVAESRTIVDMHRRHVQRIVIGLTVSVLIAITILTVIIGLQWQQGKAREIALHAQLQMDTDPELGLLLAINSLDESETPENGKLALVRGLAESSVRSYYSDKESKSTISSVQFSPKGSTVVTAEDSGIARLCEAETGKEIRRFSSGTKALKTASFSPNGNEVIAAGLGRTATIWRVESSTPRAVLVGHGGPITSAVFSPDGKRILTASSDGSVRVWNADTGEQDGPPWLLGQGRLYFAVFSPDGSKIVTADDRKAGDYFAARVWDVSNPAAPVRELLHKSPVFKAVIGANGHTVLTASVDGIRVWDLDDEVSEKPLKPGQLPGPAPLPVGHKGPVYTAVFSPDGHRILSGGEDRTARLWDMRTGEIRIFSGHTGRILSVGFDPGSLNVVTASADGTARRWTTVPGIGRQIAIGAPGAFCDATYNPTGDMILHTGRDTKSGKPIAVIRDAKSWKELSSLTGHTDNVIRALFSPDGKRVLTTSSDRTARMWDARTGTQLMSFTGHDAPVVDASFDRDGRRVATASYDGTSKCWDVETGENRLTFPPDNKKSYLTRSVFSPDGTSILIAGYNGSRIADSQTGRILRILDDDKKAISVALFLKDGSKIVTAGFDGVIRFWDAQSDSETPTEVDDASGPIQCAALSPDGKFLATGTAEGYVFMRNIPLDREAVKFRVSSQAMLSVAFSADGRHLLTVSADGILQVVPRALDDQKRLAKERVYRQLTDSEKEKYLPLGLWQTFQKLFRNFLVKAGNRSN